MLALNLLQFTAPSNVDFVKAAAHSSC